MSERDGMIAMLWKQHHLWMSEILNKAVAMGYRADDFYKVMTDEDRKANREFIDFMHPITNPHLAKEPEKDTNWQGVIRAVSEDHRNILIVRDDGKRFIAEPENWDLSDIMALMEKHTVVYASGLEIPDIAAHVTRCLLTIDATDEE